MEGELWKGRTNKIAKRFTLRTSWLVEPEVQADHQQWRNDRNPTQGRAPVSYR